MVLASSVRRGGRSLASLARTEVGPVAGMATTLAILYVIIIALAGLGIVVVKALGGEEVTMKAGTTLEAPADGTIQARCSKDAAGVLRGPAGRSTYHYGPGAGESMLFHEGPAWPSRPATIGRGDGRRPAGPA